MFDFLSNLGSSFLNNFGSDNDFSDFASDMGDFSMTPAGSPELFPSVDLMSMGDWEMDDPSIYASLSDAWSNFATSPLNTSFSDLTMLRNYAPNQSQIAPWEHAAYARDVVEENPLTAFPLMGMIPGYQAAKATGLVGSRTGASQPLMQMGAGYAGIGKGLMNNYTKPIGNLYKDLMKSSIMQPTNHNILLGTRG